MKTKEQGIKLNKLYVFKFYVFNTSSTGLSQVLQALQPSVKLKQELKGNKETG